MNHHELDSNSCRFENHMFRAHIANLINTVLISRPRRQIPAVFSVPNLPVSKEDIPRQSDVDRWPQGVVLEDIDSEVDLQIGNDVPIALQPKVVKESDSGGTYAVRTSWRWTVNGPLGRNSHQNATTNFIGSDELKESFREFC